MAIIPYTFHNTNFHEIKKGSIVNLEFDIFGKYIAKMLTKNIIMKPTLLISAGMGSRYGGLKQIDGIGPNNEPILNIQYMM